jgi:hypothetical protein
VKITIPAFLKSPGIVSATAVIVAFYVLFAYLQAGPVVHGQSPAARQDVLDIHHLPLGDSKISNGPQRGYVMSCRAQFQGRGAQHSGPWIHGDTWDLTEKIHVQGRVMWPRATFRVTTESGDRIISRVLDGNGLPVDTPTGTFPIAYDDPAFEIDRNPNAILTQNIALTLPSKPQIAADASCVPMGMIGVALNGVAIFNALDDAGRDAVAHEVQDLCSGHPQMQGQYHYHGPSACLPNQTEKETLIGYAIDGFGIYSMYNGQGRELTDADLDECHGRTGRILWDGSPVDMYHYVLTREYPYTIGCFRGMPARLPHPGRGGRMGPPPQGMLSENPLQ